MKEGKKSKVVGSQGEKKEVNERCQGREEMSK